MRWLRFVMVVGLVFGSSGNSEAAPGPKRDLSAKQGKLKVGDVAPDFSIDDVDGKCKVRLSSRKGRPVVLFFGSCT